MNENTRKLIAENFASEKINKARNSMGVFESDYNAYYLVGSCFTKDALAEMTESELANLVAMANFAVEECN